MSETRPSGDRYQTTILNNGAYDLDVWWQEYGGGLQHTVMTGLGTDYLELSENTWFIEIKGPRPANPGTWHPVAGKNRTYTFSGTIFAYQADGDWNE